jgi:ATP-binding cassette subfamily F protein 3
VFKDVNHVIEAGQKLALVGRNGAGKSTLMRIIAGVEGGYEGQIRLGAGITVSYFAQDTPETLKGANTIEEELEAIAPTTLIPKLRNLLGAFLFRGDDVNKPIDVLSGGERSRLAILKMLLHPANLLVMDEPTNHLDLTSKDVLLEALSAFPGTVVFVSHDKFFLEGLATSVLELEDGKYRFFPGDYRYYSERKAAEKAAALGLEAPEPKKSAPKASSVSTSVSGQGVGQGQRTAAPVSSLLSREEEKARKAQEKRQAKRESELMERIEVLEKRQAEVEAAMALPENYSSGEKMKALNAERDAVEADLTAAMAEWETIGA